MENLVFIDKKTENTQWILTSHIRLYNFKISIRSDETIENSCEKVLFQKRLVRDLSVLIDFGLQAE